MADAQAVGQLLMKAAADPALAARVLGDPRSALAQAGVTLPASVAVQAFRNDGSTVHAVLPVEGPGELEAARRMNPLAARVFERAWRDAAFKQRLMTNPRAAFVEATGVTPPASLTLVAHENTPTSISLVIPYVAGTGELSDRDLEQVAGGKGSSGCDTTMQIGYSVLGASPAVATGNLAVGGATAGVGAAMMIGSGIASAFK